MDGADRKAIDEGLKVISRDLGLKLDLEAIKAHKPAAEKNAGADRSKDCGKRQAS